VRILGFNGDPQWGGFRNKGAIFMEGWVEKVGAVAARKRWKWIESGVKKQHSPQRCREQRIMHFKCGSLCLAVCVRPVPFSLPACRLFLCPHPPSLSRPPSTWLSSNYLCGRCSTSAFQLQMSVVRAGIKSGWWKCAKVQGYTENKFKFQFKSFYFFKKNI